MKTLPVYADFDSDWLSRYGGLYLSADLNSYLGRLIYC